MSIKNYILPLVAGFILGACSNQPDMKEAKPIVPLKLEDKQIAEIVAFSNVNPAVLEGELFCRTFNETAGDPSLEVEERRFEIFSDKEGSHPIGTLSLILTNGEVNNITFTLVAQEIQADIETAEAIAKACES